MQGKITLITSPDFFENENVSVLFMNLSPEDQDEVSKYLVDKNIKNNYNFYVYSNEDNIAWLLYAINRCDFKFIDFDNSNNVLSALGGYIVGKNNVCYKTSDQNLIAIYSHLTQNRITNITNFLERIFSE